MLNKNFVKYNYLRIIAILIIMFSFDNINSQAHTNNINNNFQNDDDSQDLSDINIFDYYGTFRNRSLNSNSLNLRESNCCFQTIKIFLYFTFFTAIISSMLGITYYNSQGLRNGCNIMLNSCNSCTNQFKDVQNILNEAKLVLNLVKSFIEKCPSSKDIVEKALDNIFNQCCNK